MTLTEHAHSRKRQRGFSNFALNIILRHGNVQNVVGGATKVSFGKKEYQNIVGELKRTIQLMDKVKGGHIILKDDRVLTIYKN